MRRFYVTMTWEQWPEDGSYGTVVDAADHEEAVRLCREEMAKIRSEEQDYDPAQWTDDEEHENWLPPKEREGSPEFFMEELSHCWEVVDCFDVDEFIAMHSKKDATA